MADDTRDDETPDDGASLAMPSFTRRRRPKDTPSVAAAASDPVLETESPTRVRRPRHVVSLAGLPAAAVTGLVVGALGVLLVWLAGVGCEAVRGTSSCGGGPGLLVLLVVLGVLAWAGSVLLRAFVVPEAGSTSVLAVGILAVLVMVFLLGSLDEWWTAVVVPVAAAAAYCSGWWVTTAVVGEDPDAEATGTHDVR